MTQPMHADGFLSQHLILVVEASKTANLARLKAVGMIMLDDVAGFVADSRPCLESPVAKHGAERVDRLIDAGA
jgi:hypothetical protein